MKKINSFATDHPVTFGAIVTFVYILMLIVSNILGNLGPGENIYGQPGNILGRLVSIAILMVMLLRLGWLRSAGFTSVGSWGIWLVSLLSLVYAVSGYAYTLNGNFDINLSSSVLTILVVLFILTQSIMEEVVFRGLVLGGFVRAWGSTNRGILKIVLISSLIFCSIHLLDFLSGRPFLALLLQSLEAFFLGVILAVLVIRGKSIYLAFFFHCILNLGAYLSFSYKGLEPSPASWLSLSLVMLLPALFGIYLLRGLPPQSSPTGISVRKNVPDL
jgi:membrane protease YdiL (CAAX protease family)